MRKLILIALLSTQTFSFTSSSVPLPDVHIRPGDFGIIKTDKLYDSLKYKISCTLANTNAKADENSAFTIDYYVSKDITVDGKTIASGSNAVAYFKSKGSLLQINAAKNSANIYIRNIDFTDSYTLTNCKASLGE